MMITTIIFKFKYNSYYNSYNSNYNNKNLLLYISSYLKYPSNRKN